MFVEVNLNVWILLCDPILPLAVPKLSVIGDDTWLQKATYLSMITMTTSFNFSSLVVKEIMLKTSGQVSTVTKVEKKPGQIDAKGNEASVVFVWSVLSYHLVSIHAVKHLKRIFWRGALCGNRSWLDHCSCVCLNVVDIVFFKNRFRIKSLQQGMLKHWRPIQH